MPHVFVNGPVSWNLLIHTPTLPGPEPRAMFAQRHHETLGGTSAGKALNLRRLGADVTLCTLLGDDDHGERIRQRLDDAGIDVIGRRSANGSERHVNVMDADGRRLSIYLTLPTAMPIDPDHARRRAAALARADAVVVDLAEHSREVLALARRAGRPVWCDLHDYDGRSEFHAEFRDAAGHLFLSDERMAAPADFLRQQVARGKRLVVCTRGAAGVVALEAGGELVEMPAHHVPEVVDTNGAGDAFFAGFLVAHLAGRPLRDCLAAGTDAAAACVGSADLAG